MKKFYASIRQTLVDTLTLILFCIFVGLWLGLLFGIVHALFENQPSQALGFFVLFLFYQSLLSKISKWGSGA